MLNLAVGIPGGTVICRLRGRLSFLDHIENLQRGWYRGLWINDVHARPRRNICFTGAGFLSRVCVSPGWNKTSKNKEREERIMEFVSGQTKKDVVEISDILTGDYEGRDISMNGARSEERRVGKECGS